MEGAVSLAHRPIAKTCGRLPQELTELAGNWQGKETPTDYTAVTRRRNKRKGGDNGLAGGAGVGRCPCAVVAGGVSRDCLWIKLWITMGVIHMPANGVKTRFDGGSRVAYTYPLPRHRKPHHGAGNRIAAGAARAPIARHATGNKKPAGLTPRASPGAAQTTLCRVQS